MSGLILPMTQVVTAADFQGGRYGLPADPDAVVLSYQRGSADGFEPVLTLRADGRQLGQPRAPGEIRRERRQTPAAVQELLHFVLYTQAFASFNSERVQASMRELLAQKGRFYKPMDGGITLIEVTLPKLSHRVEFPALHSARAAFPEIAELQRLYAIQQHLLALAQEGR